MSNDIQVSAALREVSQQILHLNADFIYMILYYPLISGTFRITLVPAASPDSLVRS